ncbi:DUF4186 domain-containing protein [Neisseriaceae bacterium ESL0693]|nr:DUF4186 domain-containing protein [Neisseriaceae bacterium ESL0693]
MSFAAPEIMLQRLKQSAFRAKFTLYPKERSYLETKGMTTIMSHAADFIRQRLAPAMPKNDGKQTPWKGHPVFIAQHATATCCRHCLQKWHQIAEGQELSAEQQHYILNVIQAWLTQDMHKYTDQRK